MTTVTSAVARRTAGSAAAPTTPAADV